MLKKILKSVLLVIMSAIMALGAFAGCKPKNNDLLGEYSDRPQTIKVLHFNGGYGYEWLVEVSKYFMDNIDTETYVQIDNTPVDGEEGVKLSSGIQTHDVYFLGYMYDYNTAGNYLTDLSDVYNGKSTGEDMLVKDKIDDVTKDAYFPNGVDEKYYLPYGGTGSYTFCWNETTLDEALGEGNWVFPRTTDEFFELGDRLKDKDVYLSGGSYGDATDYFTPDAWFAQAVGVEEYLQMRKGYYKNDSGEYVFDESKPTVVEKQEEAYKDLYEVVSKFKYSGNLYMHRDSSAMTFLDVEGVLAGIGFGTNKAKMACLYTGPYLLNEMDPYLKTMEEAGEPQSIRAVKIPMMSSVRKRTETIKDDATLRAVIDYVDGTTNTKPSGVKDEDIEIVRESRNIGASHIMGSMAVAKEAAHVDVCKEFVRFLTSDVAQKIASDASLGIERLPYGYTSRLENEDLSELHQFVQDYKNISKNQTRIPLSPGANDVFMKYGEFDTIPVAPGNYGVAPGSPDKFYQDTLANYTTGNKWADIIKRYKAALGE